MKRKNYPLSIIGVGAARLVMAMDYAKQFEVEIFGKIILLGLRQTDSL